MSDTVLIVDDSLTVRKDLSDAFVTAGLRVLLAGSVSAALEHLGREAVGVAILDVILPDGDGLELLARIHSLEEPRPAVILLSTEDGVAQRIRGLRTGADDYVGKPYDSAYVVARARELIRARSRVVEARAAHELAETRAALVEELKGKNAELEGAYLELQTAQARLVQSAKMASLGELVAGVAHEINNPLSFAISHLATARKSLGKLGERVQGDGSQAERWHFERADNRLSEMATGLDRIRELVVKLRTFSRLDEGERKVVSVRESVESLLTIIRHRLKTRIRVVTEFGEPDRLDCYPGLLNQALLNLMSNSIDAIESEGTISIGTGADGDAYRIVIADTGHGIPEAIRSRVFEPFFTTKPVGQGTGLGLSITDSIVRKHGGTLEFGEAPGGGTVATLRLPLQPGL